jgi:hypothetical protein
MKTIALDFWIKDLAGKPVVPVLTVKQAILNLVGTMRATNGEESLKILALGLKIVGAEATVEVTDDELQLLRMAANQNNVGYFAVVLAQVVGLLA